MEFKAPPVHAPAPLLPAGTLLPLAPIDGGSVWTAATRPAREAMRSDLPLGFLDAGSPHLPDPLFFTVPGRDLPEMRLDGLPAGPVRWPETSLGPVPTLVLEDVILRPYAPINAPLSATGGPQIDMRLAPVSGDSAVSAVRLTQAAYGAYTEELVLRRPLGRFALHGFYGDSKATGHEPWRSQRGQTIGLRLGHRLADGYMEWGADDAFNRFRLLSSKKGLWDRTAWSIRWARSDSAGTSIETAASWTWTRGGWWTSRGLTERRSRSVGLRAILDRSVRRGRASLAAEIDAARTYTRRPDEAQRLLKDLSAGAAVGWAGGVRGGTASVSAGLTRLAPLAVSPVFAAEYEKGGGGGPGWSLGASRSVRNRTLPRMPADGEAWVRQGIGLAEEGEGEQPEGSWRTGFVIRGGGGGGASGFRIGSDLLWMTRTLEISSTQLPLLGTDAQASLPAAAQRGERRYLSTWGRGTQRLPFGFRLEAYVCNVVAEGGVRRDLGLPGLRGTGELGWRGELFKRDLKLDLGLQGSGRTQAATPYGTLPAQGRVDASAMARIGPVDLFLVLANLTDAITTSMTYDGGFHPLPRRNMSVGVRWVFFD